MLSRYVIIAVPRHNGRKFLHSLIFSLF